MKKLLTVLSIFILTVLLTCSTVFANDSVYRLDDIGLQLTIPSDYYVLTRDTPADDAFYTMSNTSKEKTMQQWNVDGTYFYALSFVDGIDITVRMEENEFVDFSLLNNTELNLFLSAVTTQFSDYGFIVSNSEVYQHTQTKLFKFKLSNAEKVDGVLQYSTANDGKAIHIIITSLTGALSDEQERLSNRMIDNLVFDSAPVKPVFTEELNSYVYTDEKTGVSFTVPANWKQEALSDLDSDAYADAQLFVYKTDPGGFITYASIDLWELLPDSKKNGYARSSLNSDNFDDEADKGLLEGFGFTDADNDFYNYSKVDYNGITYRKVEMLTKTNLNGFDFSAPVTMLLYIKNGWEYVFQFYGDKNSSAYSDFEALIRSVQYPVTSKTIDSKAVSAVFLIITLPLLVAAVAFFVIRSNKKRTTEQNEIPTQTIYCKNCGIELPEDSVFCHKCGTCIERTTPQ